MSQLAGARLTFLVLLTTLLDLIVIQKVFFHCCYFCLLADISFSKDYLLDYFPSLNGFHHTSLRMGILTTWHKQSCACLGVTQVSLLSNQRSFNCVIKINPMKTANAANESICLCALSQQGRIVVFYHIIHQTSFKCSALAIAVLAVDTHQVGRPGTAWSGSVRLSECYKALELAAVKRLAQSSPRCGRKKM